MVFRRAVGFRRDDNIMAVARRAPSRVHWMNARTERDFAAAEKIAHEVLQLRPDDEAIRRATARTMHAGQRHDEALPLWRTLAQADPTDFESAYHVARAAMAAGRSAKDAAADAAAAATPAFRDNLVAALGATLPIAGSGFRHLAICGVSYCGSTLLDRVLGGLPGVKSIGESHWIVKERGPEGYRNIDFSRPIAESQVVPCTVCGRDCETLSLAFRLGLAADHTDWYRKIAARLGTDILVSADKNAPKLVDNDPLLNLSALVVFKSPEQAWRSKLNKLPADRDADYYEAECQTYIPVWTRSYRTYLDRFNPAGTVGYLNFDAFALCPAPLLRAVCDTFGLPFDESVLTRTEPGHAIGGNTGSMARLRALDYGVKIAALPDADLDPAHTALIADDKAMQDTWAELMEKHRELAAKTA